MSSDATTPPSSDVARQLELTREQLALYASELKRVLALEREKAGKLEAANRQLQAYAQDLKTQHFSEKQKSRELERAYHETVLRLVAAMRFRDEETGAHVVRLAHFSRLVALHLGWSRDDAERLFQATPMHDLGKIGVPDAILLKAGPLSPEEWTALKRHTEIGAALLQGSASPVLEMASEIALTHHERWDGSGYPRGLKGEAIPLPGRVVMLADQYDALRTRRPYKPSRSHADVCAVICQGDDRTLPQHFDPAMLAAFQAVHAEFEAAYARFRD